MPRMTVDIQHVLRQLEDEFNYGDSLGATARAQRVFPDMDEDTVRRLLSGELTYTIDHDNGELIVE